MAKAASSFFVHQDGRKSVTVGGVKTLTEFSSEQVSLRVKGGLVCVHGAGLEIDRFDVNEIVIRGEVLRVEVG